MVLEMFAASSAAVTAALSASGSEGNSVFCGGVASISHAPAALAMSAIISTIGKLRRTIGWASISLIWRIGLANRSGSVLVGVSCVAIDYTGMLIMS